MINNFEDVMTNVTSTVNLLELDARMELLASQVAEIKEALKERQPVATFMAYDSQEAYMLSKASSLWTVVHSFLTNTLRTKIKYGVDPVHDPDFKNSIEALEWARKELYMLLATYNIDLDSLP